MSLFSSVRVNVPKRNNFKLSHQNKLSTDFGVLTPILLQDTYPGDTFHINSNILCRLAPMISPIMQDIDVYTHFFFVPYRLVWDKWKEFITQGEDGTTIIPYPVFSPHNAGDSIVMQHGSLADYLDYPTHRKEQGPIDVVDVDILPFRAYQLIYNEYYRDENLQDEVDIKSDLSGMISDGNYIKEMCKIRHRCFKKDYFTSALPFAQRGEEVELPIVGQANVVAKNPDGTTPVNVDFVGRQLSSSSLLDAKWNHPSGSDKYQPAAWDNNRLSPLTVDASFRDANIAAGLNVDLSNVSAATINELRRAIKAQEFLEARARGGSRYIEQIMTIFGQKSSDARLQRPEFIGGAKSPIVISDVLQTSQTTESSPQATPSGHGVGVQFVDGINYHCEEHGFIIGIMSIMPKAAYSQGMPRQRMYRDALDFYWPQFAHLGEQEIKLGELYWDPQNKDNNNKLFGYTPRYAEHKFRFDRIHGDFKDSLKFWTMAREFSNAPALNGEFLTDMSCTRKVFAVQDPNYSPIWCQIEFDIQAKRPMPKYGTPRI